MHLKRWRRLLAASVVVFSTPWAPTSYALDREYAIKAAFLYNFFNYIKWPGADGAGNTRQAKLCIVGKDPFGNALSALKKKVRTEWDLIIERVAIDHKLPELSCHIVFVSYLEPDYATVIKSLANSGVLTVSDIEGFARDFGIIELAERRDKIKLIINADRLEEANLKASSKLMKISEIVRSRK